jgi:transposase
VVCLRLTTGATEIERFANDAAGHRALIKRLTKKGRRARTVLESTGVYSFEISLALHHAPRVEVMVVNPKAAKDFAGAFLKRTKTDPEDALVLLEFVERMPFVPWQPPSDAALGLRAHARRLHTLTRAINDERNRLHASRYLGEASDVIQNDIEVNVRHLERRSELLTEQAVALVKADPELHRRFRLLVTVKGIATTSAIQILGELAVLPPDMSARQWAAHAGLDPRHCDSGTSVAKPTRISKVGNERLRSSLYMPALVAIRFDPHVKRFYDALLARGKKPLQAIVAVMRKLLHAIHAIITLDVHYDSSKFAFIPPGSLPLKA